MTQVQPLAKCAGFTSSARSRIIVVDDDKSVADVVSLMLHQAGFQVTTFYDAFSAAQFALESEPDAVITDYSMPNMNGLQLATRESCPGCKIVIMSGEAAAVAQQANGNLKFTLLQKPINLVALIAAVQ